MLPIKEVRRSSEDLRNHYSEISRQCRENGEAVIITVLGRKDTVFLSCDAYRDMKARIGLLELLSDAEDDVTDGRTAPVMDTFDDLRKTLRQDG